MIGALYYSDVTRRFVVGVDEPVCRQWIRSEVDESTFRIEPLPSTLEAPLARSLLRELVEFVFLHIS
jgi:hypothetical protein